MAGVAIGLFLVLFVALPVLIDMTPAPEDDRVPSGAEVRLRFRLPVDTTSVEERLRFDPSREGELVWEGWTLIFRPDSPWPSGGKVTVQLSAGARVLGFLPVLSARSWTFSVDVARVMYLWPSWDDADLYLKDLSAQHPLRLTRTTYGVIDYVVDREGTNVFYAALRPDGGSDLRVLNLTSGEDRLEYACPGMSRCRALALHPSEDYLAFERHDSTVGAAGRPVAGPPEVWVLPLRSGETAFPIAGEAHSTSQPLFSPSGWLAYYNERLRAVALLDTITEAGQPVNFIPNDLGLLGSWSPDGSGLALVGMLVSEVDGDPAEATYRSHIYLVQVHSGHTVDLSRASEELVEDASPRYSPSGDWIAFSRRSLREEQWSLGRQLWLMRPDGTEAAVLTDSPVYNHASFTWSPDSRRLVFLRKNQSDLAEPPELWWLDVETGERGLLVEGGYLPYWMP